MRVRTAIGSRPVGTVQEEAYPTRAFAAARGTRVGAPTPRSALPRRPALRDRGSMSPGLVPAAVEDTRNDVAPTHAPDRARPGRHRCAGRVDPLAGDRRDPEVRHHHARRQGRVVAWDGRPPGPLLGVPRGGGRGRRRRVSAWPPITPDFVLTSPLDGNAIAAPNVRVNQDVHCGARKTRPRSRSTRITRTGSSPRPTITSRGPGRATSNGTPCSALGDGYSGTYFCNDGGTTWCCTSTDPSHLGTLIPGVDAPGRRDL